MQNFFSCSILLSLTTGSSRRVAKSHPVRVDLNKQLANHRFFSLFNDFSFVVKFFKTFCKKKTII